MVQKYKVFYKYNTIFFEDFKSYTRKTSDTHVLLSPDKGQIFAAINSCFLKKNSIKNIMVLSEQAEKDFKAFTENMILIEAAGGVVLNDYNEFLFIKRASVWDLPKGKIDEGESIEEAAIREVKEETGISSLSIIKELKPSYHIYPEDDRWVYKITYWFLMLGAKEKLSPQLDENITEARWLDSKQVKTVYKNIFSSLKSVIKDSRIKI